MTEPTDTPYFSHYDGLDIKARFVSFAPAADEKPMDGLLIQNARSHDTLLVFVHGMYSNFYSSCLKKELMMKCGAFDYDMLTFNNRGAEFDVLYETFENCLDDLDAALKMGRRRGYRRFILIGHSTGCQKIVYYQAMRRQTDVSALILLGAGDDYAIAKREAGHKFSYWVKRAEKLVAEDRGATLLPAVCSGFSAQRYLSIAKPESTEAQVFNYAGELLHFSKIKLPLLSVFGSEEEYACIPVEEMQRILRDKTHSVHFTEAVIPGAGHSFHGYEQETAKVVLEWIKHDVKKQYS